MEFPEILHEQKALTSISINEYDNIFVKTGIFSFIVVNEKCTEYFNYEPIGTWIPLGNLLSPTIINAIDWPKPILCTFEVSSRHVIITSDENQECIIKYDYENETEKMIIVNNFFINPEKEFKEQLLSWG